MEYYCIRTHMLPLPSYGLPIKSKLFTEIEVKNDGTWDILRAIEGSGHYGKNQIQLKPNPYFPEGIEEELTKEEFEDLWNK